MRSLGPCETCLENGDQTEAIEMVDRTPMCSTHARCVPVVERLPEPEQMPPPVEKELCSRGCGKPRHRGVCAGTRAVAPKPVEVPAEPIAPPIEPPAPIRTTGGRLLDTLICTEVMESEVPLDAEEIGNGLGRLGDLWNRLQDLRPNRRLAVINRDRKHARETRRHISVKAEKAGLELVASIHNTTLYCRLERKEKTAA